MFILTSRSCSIVVVVYFLLICSLSFFLISVFFFKQKAAYELRISDWSSDVCSSDLVDYNHQDLAGRTTVLPGSDFCAPAACNSGDNDPMDTNGQERQSVV